MLIQCTPLLVEKAAVAPDVTLTVADGRISRRGGRGPRRRGCGLPRWLRFENFVCQNERIGPLGGGRVPGVPP